MEKITLKWGSIKSWSDMNVEGLAFAALKRYHDEPVSMSAAAQRDTETQKQALIDCIENLDGEIWNEWSGEKMTKDEAKKYILEYGND